MTSSADNTDKFSKLSLQQMKSIVITFIWDQKQMANIQILKGGCESARFTMCAESSTNWV